MGFVRLRQGYGGISSCQRRHRAEARAEFRRERRGMAERVGVFERDLRKSNKYPGFWTKSRKSSDLASSACFRCFRPLAANFRFFCRDDTRHDTGCERLRSSSRRNHPYEIHHLY